MADPEMLTKRPFENLSFEDLDAMLETIATARNLAWDERKDPTYEAPKEGWRCFHCNHVYYHAHQARLHFGATPHAKPQCQLPTEARELMRELRSLEDELEQYRNAQ